MTKYSDFKKALVANVKKIEAQRRVVVERKKKATQLAEERERRRINYSLDQWDARREQQRRVEEARREQQRRVKIAVREERQREEQAQREDEEAQGQANRAILMFTLKRETFHKEFDKIKSATVNEVNRRPRAEDLLVAWIQKMGESAASLSDVFRIAERNGLKKLMDDFIEEREMSSRTRQYFMRMAAPLLMPRPKREIDDIVDMQRTMAHARAGSGNQELTNTLLLKLMTETVPGLQVQANQNLQMAYQSARGIKTNKNNPPNQGKATGFRRKKAFLGGIGVPPMSQKSVSRVFHFTMFHKTGFFARGMYAYNRFLRLHDYYQSVWHQC